jgi:hypothetical protein
MNGYSLCQLLGIVLLCFGGPLLLAGFLSLNAVVGLRSKQDGRTFIDKQLGGSWSEYRQARTEMAGRMGEQWRSAPVTRALVYFGGGLVLCTLVCFAVGG